MARPKIERDLIDRALLYKAKISWIPDSRIERECWMPRGSMSVFRSRWHIPMKYRDNMNKYFKFIASKLW